MLKNFHGFRTPQLRFTSPEIFEDMLDEFHITLYLQTQHCATHGQDVSTSPIVESAWLCTYCPVKGGHCVVGETVRELARRVGADVVLPAQFDALVRVRHLLLTCTFTDYMRLTQP